MSTAKNSWSFLRDYGAAVKLKEVASLSQLAALKTDLKNQIMREPETAAVSVDTQLTAGQVLTVTTLVQMKRGSSVSLKFSVGPDGSFQVL